MGRLLRLWWGEMSRVRSGEQSGEQRLAEEAKTQVPHTWKQFSDGFFEKFFPELAQKDLEERFISLE